TPFPVRPPEGIGSEAGLVEKIRVVDLVQLPLRSQGGVADGHAAAHAFLVDAVPFVQRVAEIDGAVVEYARDFDVEDVVHRGHVPSLHPFHHMVWANEPSQPAGAYTGLNGR